MPETIRSAPPAAPALVPGQRGARPASPRQAREQAWVTLVRTHRLLSRLVVERTRHHLPDEADTLARQAVLVEEQLEHDYPVRWPRLHVRLLLEEAGWWAEEHDSDLLDCRACRLSNGVGSDRIDVHPPRRVWA
jgi:hypothetical protein